MNEERKAKEQNGNATVAAGESGRSVSKSLNGTTNLAACAVKVYLKNNKKK